MRAELVCGACGNRYTLDAPLTACACGGLLDVERPDGLPPALTTAVLDQRRGGRAVEDQSGVWRFREAVLDVPAAQRATRPEGRTPLYRHPKLTAHAGVAELAFKHEGENPTGSFKDRGMTVAITQARRLGATTVACASTGNTSASLAAYAGLAGLRPVVFLPAGKTSSSKLAQTLAYGALCLAVRGDFDQAMALVVEASAKLGIYLVNSMNPFRIEGQKTIVWDLLQDLAWEPPDWIVVPAGNLGNTAAFGKALREAQAAGWISKVPRLAAVQAAGANPFALGFADGFRARHRVAAETIATAIRIGNPVSWDRAVRAIRDTDGVVLAVTDDEILAAKREIDRAGLGCEPASAATLAGLRQLRAAGTLAADARVVCVLTGHVLKDPDAVATTGEKPVEIDPTVQAVESALKDWGA